MTLDNHIGLREIADALCRVADAILSHGKQVTVQEQEPRMYSGAVAKLEDREGNPCYIPIGPIYHVYMYVPWDKCNGKLKDPYVVIEEKREPYEEKYSTGIHQTVSTPIEQVVTALQLTISPLTAPEESID